MLRRLFQQVYLTIVVSLILVVLAAGAAWRFGAEHPQVRQAFELAGDMAAAALPPAEAPVAAQQWALDRIHERHGVDLALFNARLRPMAAAGRPLPSPPRHHLRSGWLRGGHGPTWLLHLPDGRWLVVRMGINRLTHPAVGLAGFLAVIALRLPASHEPGEARLWVAVVVEFLFMCPPWGLYRSNQRAKPVPKKACLFQGGATGEILPGVTESDSSRRGLR